MKEKKESRFKQIERSIFINMTRNKSKKEYNEVIERITEETGEKPDIDVRRKIRKQIVDNNAKKMKNRAMLTATSIILSGAIGLGTGYALNEGSGTVEGVTKTEYGINIDTAEIDGKVVIEVKDQKELSFRDKYKVSQDNEIVVKHGEKESELIDLYELENTVTQEVKALENDEEILNYVKKEYVEEYNRINDEKINVENVKLYRSTLGNFDEIIYEDFTKNGDKIIRVCDKTYGKENELSQVMGSTGELVYISINGELKEIAVGVSSHFERGYSGNEEIDKIDENSLAEKMGNLLNAGTAYVNARENDKSLYEKKLINAMIDYKKGKIEEITNTKVSNEKESEGFDIGD